MTQVIIPPATSRYRDMSDAISPTWLNGPVGQRFRYCQSVLFDALSDATGYAVRSRFPSLAPYDAFPLLASDRQMDQGFSESNASFALRLPQWLDLWRCAGSSMSVLLALLGLFLPTSIRVRTVDNSSNWYTYDYSATPFPPGASVPTPPTYVTGANNWNWDGNTAPWWRCWVIIYATNLGWTTGPKWGTGNWGDPSRLWGLGGPTAQMVETIFAVIKKWKPAHAWVANVIISLSDTLFNPALPQGGGINPDGTWGNPLNRPANAVFLGEVV